jgi:hypothetical protein
LCNAAETVHVAQAAVMGEEGVAIVLVTGEEDAAIVVAARGR